MCLISLAVDAHPTYRLVVAANRDEFHARPAAAAAAWVDAPSVIAGRDLTGQGTWLGVTVTGRFAAITNHRAPRFMSPSPGRSRGKLVSDFLMGRAAAAGFGAQLRRTRADYHGYNLIFGDDDSIWCYESVPDRLRAIGPGIWGLSNHLWDTPWPKVVHAKTALRGALAGSELADRALLEAFQDRRPAADDALPDTGIGLDWERRLSSAFIAGAEYGTRATTILTLAARGGGRLDEWRYDPAGRVSGHVRVELPR